MTKPDKSLHTHSGINNTEMETSVRRSFKTSLKNLEERADIQKAYASIKSAGSPFKDVHYPEMKTKIMPKLQEAMNKLAASPIKSAEQGAKNQLSIGAFASAATVAAVLLGSAYYLTLNGQNSYPEAPLRESQVLEETKVSADENYPCYISINKNKYEPVSKDEPIVINSNEIANLKFCNGMTAVLKGPASLSVYSEGFRLLSGEMKIKMVKGKQRYTCSTPHGKISIFGSECSLKVTGESTTITVYSGMVSAASYGEKAHFVSKGKTSIIRKHQSEVGDCKVAPLDEE